MLRFSTAGESHGKGLVGMIEGIPAGLKLKDEDINSDLKRRQGGYGRGGRMKIESDTANIMSGLRWGETLGSPIALVIENRDFANWEQGMSRHTDDMDSIPAVTRPRPGHADLPGAQKYGHTDVRNILERSSARETAMRVALGAIAKRLLDEFGITVGSYITSIGSVAIDEETLKSTPHEELFKLAEKSEVRCPDDEVSADMKSLIDKAQEDGNSLGGIFVVFATGLPVGLGSHVQWDSKLDGRLAQALMSIQAIKGVEAGIGFEAARHFGSEVMDEIISDDSNSNTPYGRTTNNAGGIEGGMTNGMPVVLKVAMKPIPTLRRALRSVDIHTGESIEAAYERSDVCAAPAAAVIGESMVALILAQAFLEKFGGDSINETRRNYESYKQSLSEK